MRDDGMALAVQSEKLIVASVSV
ncbi:hypothetical protein NSND_50947 [Nitrospira sp. ND1]|nr:hypothetical protein NSND_50947 [Nitrospira sp. ND1]